MPVGLLPLFESDDEGVGVVMVGELIIIIEADTSVRVAAADYVQPAGRIPSSEVGDTPQYLVPSSYVWEQKYFRPIQPAGGDL